MLSRHNIRIKVLQNLYAYTQQEGISPKTMETQYLQNINSSYRLFILNLLYLWKVASYNKKDYDIKMRKYVPTEEDKNASLKLYNNPIVEAIRTNENLQKRFQELALLPLVEEDLVRRLYRNFVQSEYYQTYLDMPNPPVKEHQYCLVKLYKTMAEDEVFVEQMDNFVSWDEDKSLIFGALKRSIRSLPNNNEFYVDNEPNTEFVHYFGKELLYLTIRHNDELQELIKPKLVNWKEDRVAITDMVLMKMALCEFINFPTIPTKVTINEYVALAKNYSTENSKRFVNGILDRLMKELKEAGRIQKTGRGLRDN